VDTGDPIQLSQLIGRAQARFGRIDSVIRAGDVTLRASA
jgi:hypothetical protein